MRAAVVRSGLEVFPGRGMWLRLGDTEGRVGIGEAAPLPGFSRDGVEECVRALAEVHEELGPLDDEAPAGEAVALALAPVEERLARAPTARVALETALLDLSARRLGVPLSVRLGGPPSPPPVPVNGLCRIEPATDLVARARAVVEAGLPALKVKLRSRDDLSFRYELDRLHAVREALPARFEIRLDANASWSLGGARARLWALRAIAPSFVEQPVAAGDLARIGEATVPLAADESLALEGMGEALLDVPVALGRCSVFVLKPAILGLCRARGLGLLAHSKGLDVVVTHLFDGPVGLAAAAELALSFMRAPLASGLDRHAGLADFPPALVPQLETRVAARATGREGLGLEREEAWSWTR